MLFDAISLSLMPAAPGLTWKTGKMRWQSILGRTRSVWQSSSRGRVKMIAKGIWCDPDSSQWNALTLLVARLSDRLELRHDENSEVGACSYIATSPREDDCSGLKANLDQAPVAV